MDELMKREVKELMENARVVYVSSVDSDGFPNTKAMLSLYHDGILTHYFSTNYSARRTKQFIQNPKACIYYCDDKDYKGLLLLGHMEVCTDKYHKELLWREGFEIYYPKGVEDEDYCVFKFTAEKANYYHGLSNASFDVLAFQQSVYQ